MPLVAVITCTTPACQENLTLFLPTNESVYSSTDVSGTGARNVRMAAENQNRIAITGFPKFAGTDDVTS